MSDLESIRELIQLYRRRRLALRKQHALYGARSDPSIIMEIEDLEAEIAKFEIELRELQAGEKNSRKPMRGEQLKCPLNLFRQIA